MKTATVTLTLSLLMSAVGAQAAPVTDALDRPAVMSRHAATSVLLGVARSGNRVVAVGERGIVVVSDDQGQQWRQVPAPVSVTLTAVRFLGAHGFAVGHGGTVLGSEDGGLTWTRLLDGRRAAQTALDAAQAGGDEAAIKAAQQLVTDGPDKPFLDVLIFDAQRALVVGAYGLAFGTEDGGKTWASWMPRIDNPKGLHLYTVRARGERIVIAGEQGTMLLSDDGGNHFERVVTPYAGSFFTAELPRDNEIVVAGMRGNVWRSTDGGRQWAQVKLPMSVSITGSALRPDGSLLLVNQAGMVLAGSGDKLMPVKAPPMPPLNAVLPRADGSLLAVGMQGVKALPSPSKSAP